MIRKSLNWFIRLTLGGAFCLSGAIKLTDPASFGDIIATYGLLPDGLIGPAAYGLPLMELAAGLGLIFGLPGALSLITGLLMLFCGVLWFGILRDLQVDCGCFSVSERAGHTSLEQALIRDLLMLAAAGALFTIKIRERRYTKLNHSELGEEK